MTDAPDILNDLYTLRAFAGSLKYDADRAHRLRLAAKLATIYEQVSVIITEEQASDVREVKR